MVSLVLTSLNYSNATLAGVASDQLDRLQSVTNDAARLVCSARNSDHITPLLRDLHWIRVPQRIEFKLSVLVFRCLYGMAKSDTVPCGKHGLLSSTPFRFDAPAACSTNASRHHQRPRFRVETDRWTDMTDCSTLPTKCSQ